jgi:hypothetical protein
MQRPVAKKQSCAKIMVFAHRHIDPAGCERTGISGLQSMAEPGNEKQLERIPQHVCPRHELISRVRQQRRRGLKANAAKITSMHQITERTLMISRRLSEHVVTRRLSRRDVIAAMAATVTAGMQAQAQNPEESVMYFVPGGRLGFRRPAAIKPFTNSWHLLSSDQTMWVDVREALRIDSDWDDRMWQPGRHALVASGFLSPDIEHRHFRDQRYGSDANYGADTHVFRDDHWIGQVTVSTSTLGSPVLSIPGGQIARWRDVSDALVASVTVRAPLPASEALAELSVDLALEGLNPRLVGDNLILSLEPAATPLEASAIRGSYIRLTGLSLLPLGSLDELERNTNEAFDIYRKTPGSRVISSSHGRGVVLPEIRSADADDQTGSTRVMAFGRTRQLTLDASYNGRDRDQMLQALERVVSSLSLPDRQ